MKRIMILCGVVMWSIAFSPIRAAAQANELAQLALNIEKLMQFRSILSDLRKGYQIVSKGYGLVKDLSKGNFSLHKTFLDGLLEVSPAVRNYYKVGLIVERQMRLVSLCKRGLSHFKASGLLVPGELAHLEKVYGRVMSESLDNLAELANVLTSGKYRMSDDERLKTIDRIFSDLENDFVFLREFNADTGVRIRLRQGERGDVDGMRKIYGLK
ncbi:hypothetical protein ABIE26_002947 [Pedobacter africanus]|uniref:TerB family tellurite resistance protein n=1 Tax=Pedobacter africanus TaxID=151894 RepID=UPI003392D92E